MVKQQILWCGASTLVQNLSQVCQIKSFSCSLCCLQTFSPCLSGSSAASLLPPARPPARPPRSRSIVGPFSRRSSLLSLTEKPLLLLLLVSLNEEERRGWRRGAGDGLGKVNGPVDHQDGPVDHQDRNNPG